MKSTLIENYKGRKIVKVEDGSITNWVVCNDYDESAPEYQKWSAGKYFDSLVDAVFYAGRMNEMLLLSIRDDDPSGNPSGFIVRNREEGYEKIQKFMEEHGMDKEVNWETLKKTDYVKYGENGHIRFENYELGDEIDLL